MVKGPSLALMRMFSGPQLLFVRYTGLKSLNCTIDLMVGDVYLVEILDGMRLPNGLIFLVKIDNNLATGDIVNPLHHAVLEFRSFCVFCILKNMLLGSLLLILYPYL